MSDQGQTASPLGNPHPFRFEDRLLAEALRLYEDGRGGGLAEPRAEAAARLAGGDFEHRILARARHVSVAPALNAALSQLYSATLAAVVIGLILAFASGVGAARLVFDAAADGWINFFVALIGLLGIHTLAFLLWLVLLVLRPGGPLPAAFGGMLLTLGRWIGRRFASGPLEVAAIQAVGRVLSDPRLSRWAFSTISHAVWLAFLSGSLLTVLFLLSARQYDFMWETTILADRHFVALVQALSGPTEVLGFAAPDADDILLSRGPRPPSGVLREAWAGLLVGSLVVYGLGPRLLAFCGCLALFTWSRERFRLDTHHMGYARLRAAVMPASQATGIVTPAPAPEVDTGAPPLGALPFGAGSSVAIVGVEIEPPQNGWPPDLARVTLQDLGLIESRAERHRLLHQLSRSQIPLCAVVVVCSLAATPDRGTAAFIADIQRRAGVGVILLLTEGQRLRARGDSSAVALRSQEWRRLASRAAVPSDRVIEMDLDHLTAASRLHVARVLGKGAADRPPAGHIHEAFALILAHAQGWQGAPPAAEQAELQRALARLYRDDGDHWRGLLGLHGTGNAPSLRSLDEGAARMIRLLPDRLRRNTRWLAAGALAGGLACVAAAAVASPLAIAALPAWAGLGAAVSGLLAQLTGDPSLPADRPPPHDLGRAITAAALFAILLELQGRDEATITRLLDHVADDEPPVLERLDDARAWLDDLERRLKDALTTEAAV